MMTQSIPENQNFNQTATMLKAIADPNRLRIMDLLMEGETCNCELIDRLGLTANLLSHHLRVLKKANLISGRRDAVDARWIYYRVNRDVVAQWYQWWTQFLDPHRIQDCKKLCGPEGQLVPVNPQHLVVR